MASNRSCGQTHKYEGGFTRAAHRLGISQPAVTVQVRAIERAHGLRLFHRRGGSVELTDFGRELLSRTRRVFALLDEVDDLLHSAGALMRGQLELGADGPFAVMGLGRRLPRPLSAGADPDAHG